MFIIPINYRDRLYGFLPNNCQASRVGRKINRCNNVGRAIEKKNRNKHISKRSCKQCVILCRIVIIFAFTSSKIIFCYVMEKQMELIIL